MFSVFSYCYTQKSRKQLYALSISFFQVYAEKIINEKPTQSTNNRNTESTRSFPSSSDFLGSLLLLLDSLFFIDPACESNASEINDINDIKPPGMQQYQKSKG